MFSIERSETPLPTVTLVDADASSRVVVAPGRGGLVTRFSAGGREVFFLDEATLLDPAANVRGGNPVLFPSPGRLTAGAWARAGHHGALAQHGFARNLPWRVAGVSTEGRASVTLALRDTEETRARYPWPFAVDLTYALSGRSLAIEARVENRGAEPMPFGLGFHPYFLVPQADKAAARIPTGATTALDNKAGHDVPFRGFDLTLPEVDLHLHDHGRADASLELPGLPPVRLRGSAELTHWVVWTLAGRPFVCLEPWSCPGDALNTGDRLLVLPPGAARTLTLAVDA